VSWAEKKQKSDEKLTDSLPLEAGGLLAVAAWPLLFIFVHGDGPSRATANRCRRPFPDGTELLRVVTLVQLPNLHAFYLRRLPPSMFPSRNSYGYWRELAAPIII
jgi:hypothetical protein